MKFIIENLETEIIFSKFFLTEFDKDENNVYIIDAKVLELFNATAFASATYKRGCRLILVPTTLLGMVDAAIGGKTGVNFDNIKNGIGCFYPAEKVIIDTDFLETQQKADYRDGFVEIVKMSFLPHSNLAEMLFNEQNIEGIIKAKSLLSLNEFADEVVVVNNNSTDRTLTEIEQVKELLKYKLIVEDEPSDDICKVSNHALYLTSYRWIFRWDSDFIAHTSGERNIKFLREYLLNLDPKKHYLIFPLTFSFAGDLFHVKTDKETNSEGYIHTWHPKLKYIRKGKFESLQFPFFYKIKRLKEIYFVHIGSAKPIKKLLYRFFWLFWLNERDKFVTIDEYIDHISKEKWNSLSPHGFDFTN